MQVGDDLATVAPILQERAQCRGHDLGALWVTQTCRLGLHEANDIRRSELIEVNLCGAKCVLKKASYRIAVQVNRRSGEPAFAQQILFEFPSNSQGWRNHGQLLGTHLVSIWSNEPGKRIKCECVTAPSAPLQPTVIEVFSYMLRREAVALGPALIEPNREVLD